MKKIKLLALLLVSVLSVNVWGADETVTWSVSTSTANTITKDSGTLPTDASASMTSDDNQQDKSQLTSGKKQTFTLTGMDGCTITGISLNMKKSSKGSTATVKVEVGNTTLQSGASITLETTASNYDISLDNKTTVVGAGKNVVITVTSNKNSAYVLKYIVTYSAAASTPYTVTFDAGSNGTLSCPSCTEGNKLTEESAGAGVTLPSVIANDGWKFLGWATTSGATTADAGAAGATYKPSKDITLYAVYKQLYKVTLWRNGSSTTTGWIEDDSYTLPTNETAACEEWPFKGWSTSTVPSTTTTPSFETTASKDSKTFYAVYGKAEGDPTPVTTTYTLNGNWTTDNGNWTKVEGSADIVSANSKWGLTNNGTTTGISPSSYSGISKIEIVTSKSGSGAGTASVQYGSSTQWTNVLSSSNSKDIGSTLSWTPTQPLDGYLRVSFTRTNGYIYITSIAITYSASTTTYTTSPDCAEKYSISSNITGQGSILWSLDGETFGETIAKQPENTGIYFKLVPTSGWEIDGKPSLSTGGEVTDMEYDNIYGFEMPASAVTVSATFKQPATYMILYDLGNFTDATGDLPDPEEVAPGTNYSVNTTDKLSLTGYTFKGWNTDKNATTGLTNITVNDDITLYAIFTINSYNVTFNPSITGGSIKVNGSSTSPVQAQYNKDVTITVTPTTHFNLSTLTYNNTDIKTAKSFKMPAENVEIVYSFTEDPKVTVTFKNNGETLTTDGTREVYVNDPIGTLPTLTSADAKDARSKTFVGWTTDKLTNWQATSPTLVSASTTVTEALELNAVWAKGGNVYELIGDDEELTSTNYIIDGFYNSTYGDYVMINTFNSNNQLQSKHLEDTDYDEDENIINPAANAIWKINVLNKTNKEISIQNVANGKYIFFEKNSNDNYYHLAFSDSEVALTYNTVSHGEGSNISWKFFCKNPSSQRIRCYYNTSKEVVFRAYDSDDSNDYDIYLYKQTLSDYITHSSSSPLESITLNTDKVKKNYFVGETFTSANLSATAKLKDGIEFQVEHDALTIEGPDNLSTAGEKTVTVKYTFNNQERQAEYKVNAYSVTINSVYTDRVDDEPVTGNTYSWTPTTGALTFSTQAHYQFNGITSEIVGVKLNGTKPNYTLSNPTADVTLTATWQRLFTLQYNSKGGAAVSSVTDVTKNTTVETMPSPKYTGYNLVGWFDNEGYTGDAVTFPYAITKDETLYAKWEVKTTTITLSQADATTKGKEEVVATWGQPMPEATMPQREHYQFAGYKLNSTLYYKADGTSAKNWDKEDATATLTAQWSINKNKVIFTNILDGGTIKVNNQTSTIDAVDYNSTVTITATPSAHYTLTALTWNDNDILSSKSFKMPDEDVTIAATFTEDTKRTISWSVGGQIVSTTADVYDGTAFAAIKANAPAVEDDAAGDCADKFMGWATEAIDGSEGIDEGNVKWATNATTSETQNTFYAVFASAGMGSAESITYNATNLSSILGTNGYKNTDFEYSDLTHGRSQVYVNGSDIQIASGTSNCFWNKDPLPGAIKSIAVTKKTNNFTLNAGTTVKPTTNSKTVSSSTTYDFNVSDNLKYFKVSATSSSYTQITSVVITYIPITYSNYITQCCQAPEHELAITTTALTVKMGNTLQLSTDETGNGNTIKWESSNTAVATVDQTGLVTPVGTGKATITVSQEAKDPYCEQDAEVEVEVIANNEFGISFTATEGGSAVAKINDAITQKATTGTIVTIEATEASSDYIFDSWTVVSGGVSLESTTANPTTFEMGSADVEITPTFYKKTVDNIAIKTAPSVTTYTTRDHLNVTGLVITANYTKHGSEDIAYAGNEDKFSFSPALDANLTAGNQQDVTVTYDGKSTTFKIDVAQYTTPYYSLVTNASQLEAGKKVVFGTAVADHVMGYYVDNANNANNIPGVAATYNEDRSGVEVEDAAYIVSGNATDGWHFADAQGRYIYVPEESGKNYLYAATDKQDKGTWSVSVDETTHVLTMICTGVGSFDRTLLSYNTNNPGFFSCYKTTQKAVYLYIEAVKPQYVPVTSIELNETAMNVMQSKSGSLIATVGPDNATQHNVTWSIINDNANGKITVTEAGTVLVDEEAAVGATATVRATTDGTDKDGNHLTAECVITVTELETVDYMLVTTASLLQAGDIIVLGNADNSALNGAIGTDDYFDKVQATYNSAKKTMSSKYAVEITLGGNAIDGWTFTTNEGNIYASGSDGVKVSPTKDPSTWTIAIATNGTATIKAEGEGYAICYNSNSPRFKRYSTEKSIQIYSKRDTRYKRTGLTYDQAGTICLPYAVKADDYTGASVWSIESRTGTGTMISSITLVQEEGDLVAGKPYIFFAEEETFAIFCSGNPVDEVVEANGLIGNLSATPIIINPGQYQPGSYLINQNKLMECGTNCNVPQYRAYVEAEKIGATPVQAPVSAPRRVIGNPSGTPTNLNGLNGNAKAQKALIDGHIYILRDNKMYNAQGIKIQ